MSRRRSGNDSGQVMVFLVFAAVLLAGFAFLVIAVGRRLVSRQELQSGADAAAWGGAVAYAKSLNVIALGNQLMAAFLAVVIAVQIIVDVLTIAVATLTGLCASCWLTGQCWACPAIVEAQDVHDVFAEIEGDLRSAMERASGFVMDFQEGVRLAAPVLAFAAGRDAGEENAPSEATVLAIPDALELPVELGDFDLLCNHAIGMVADMVGAALPWPIDEVAAPFVERTLDAFDDHYCGRSSGEPPSRSESVEKGLPESPTECPPCACAADEDEDCDCEPCSPPGAGCAPCLAQWREHENVTEFVLDVQEIRQTTTVAPGGGAVTRTPWEAVGERRTDDVSPRWMPACEYRCDAVPNCVTTGATTTTGSLSDGFVSEQVAYEWTINACTYEEELPIAAGEALSQDVRPMKMADGWLTDGDNQMRGGAMEGGDCSARRRLVGVATRGEAEDRMLTCGLAVAQAEVWSPDPDLWTMNWRAFMRRFYLPATPLDGIVLPEGATQELFLH